MRAGTSITPERTTPVEHAGCVVTHTTKRSSATETSARFVEGYRMRHVDRRADDSDLIGVESIGSITAVHVSFR